MIDVKSRNDEIESRTLSTMTNLAGTLARLVIFLYMFGIVFQGTLLSIPVKTTTYLIFCN